MTHSVERGVRGLERAGEFTKRNLRRIGAVVLTTAAAAGIFIYSQERSEAQAIAAEQTRLAGFSNEQLAAQVINEVDACDEVTPGSLMAKELETREIGVVNGDCDDPKQLYESTVGIFSEPSPDKPTVGSLEDGEVVQIRGLSKGDSVRNYQNITDNEWALVESNETSGFVPLLWLKVGDNEWLKTGQ